MGVKQERINLGKWDVAVGRAQRMEDTGRMKEDGRASERM